MFANRATEKDIRDYLTGVGYYGRSARIHELELTAVGQSGWLQVFSGHLEAKHTEDGWRSFHFAIRDDERDRFRIELFEDEPARDAQVAEWSDGLMRRKADRGAVPLPQVLAAGAVVAVLAGLAAVRML